MYELLAPADLPVALFADSLVPLGAAIIARRLEAFTADSHLPRVAEQNPHAPLLCCRPNDKVGQGILGAMRAHPALRRLIVVEGRCDADLRDSVRRALHVADTPEPEEVANYICSIKGDATFARALRAELLGGETPRRSARHSAFKNAGGLTGASWGRLFTLVRALNLPESVTAEGAAAHLEVDVRTVRGACHTLLRMTWRDARLCFGWRWAIDRTLQVHGYLPRDKHLPLAVPERESEQRGEEVRMPE